MIKELLHFEPSQVVMMAKLQNEITELDPKIVQPVKEVCDSARGGGAVLRLVPVTATVVRGRERSPDSDTPVSLTS